MKNKQQNGRPWGVKLLIGLLGLVSGGFSTSGRADNFNVTNCVASGVSLVSWPTNTLGTNGLPQLTGGAISVANQERAGFFFQCLPLTNTNTSVIVTLVRSAVGNPPAVAWGTNAWSGSSLAMVQNDWESPSNGVTPIVLTIPVQGTNLFNWFTNLNDTLIGEANWIGVYSITNSNPGANSVLTNVFMGLNKKILPIRYP
jgi:hypothetical protein